MRLSADGTRMKDISLSAGIPMLYLFPGSKSTSLNITLMASSYHCGSSARVFIPISLVSQTHQGPADPFRRRMCLGAWSILLFVYATILLEIGLWRFHLLYLTWAYLRPTFVGYTICCLATFIRTKHSVLKRPSFLYHFIYVMNSTLGSIEIPVSTLSVF